MIYPISDNKWVSTIQVAPKKKGITITKNDQYELVPSRMQNWWRVCTDYRRLAASLEKILFFLILFINQILERLVGKTYYCCLDTYFGFHKIHDAPKNQEKTVFNILNFNRIYDSKFYSNSMLLDVLDY